jgi:IS30 family transposase
MEKSKTLKSNIKKLLKTGLSVNEISNKLNVKYITIYQAIKRNNLNYL